MYQISYNPGSNYLSTAYYPGETNSTLAANYWYENLNRSMSDIKVLDDQLFEFHYMKL